MPLRETLTNSWDHLQSFLFPMLREEVGPLTAQHQRLVVVLDVARVEAFVQMYPGLPGRPPEDRHALARAFVAKAVLDLATTSGLIERLAVDATLRRLCGWERASQVPSESTFSRTFAEFAKSSLPNRVHEALIKRAYKDCIVGHISRDATPSTREKGGALGAGRSHAAKTQAWPTEKGRGSRWAGASAAGAPTGPDVVPDAGRSSNALQRRHEEERQRIYDKLDRL